MTDSAAKRRFVVGACVVLFIGTALRLFRLDTNSFWVDEINVLSFVRADHFLDHLRTEGGPFEPPLHFVLVWLATRLPMGFETASRLPAAAAGVAEVGMVILLARRLTRRHDVAILAGLFLAVAPFAVRYSQENRYYTLFSALHLATWWLVVRALDRRDRRAFLWWGVGVGLMFLAHPFAPLVLGAQLVAIWRMTRARTVNTSPDSILPGDGLALRVRTGAVVAGIVAGPWFLWGAIRWVPDILDGRSYELNPREREAVGLSFDLFKRTTEWLLGNSARWTLLIVLLLALTVGAVAAAEPRLRRVAWWVSGYTVGFVIVLVPLTRVLRTYLAMRRIEFLLAPAVLVAAIGVVATAHRVRSWRGDVIAQRARVAIVMSVAALSVAAVLAYYSTEKTNYRALADVIARVPARDLIVVGPVDERWPASINAYLRWRGVRRDLTFVVAGHGLPNLRSRGTRVVWITGSSPEHRRFRTRALNSVADLQVIAGDRTAPGAIVAWFASTTTPKSEAALHRDLEIVGALPVVLPPPAGSSLPWWPITGR
ncbi:MAG: glycosyltransferase family 39 protein [Acidimicrobiia bacterium]